MKSTCLGYSRRPSTIHLLFIKQINFSPLCGMRWCHNIVESTIQEYMLSDSGHTTLALLLVFFLPYILYKVLVWNHLINTSSPHTILDISFSNKECTLAFPILVIGICFWAKLVICSTHGSVPILPPFIFIQKLHHPFILVSQ